MFESGPCVLCIDCVLLGLLDMGIKNLCKFKAGAALAMICSCKANSWRDAVGHCMPVNMMWMAASMQWDLPCFSPLQSCAFLACPSTCGVQGHNLICMGYQSANYAFMTLHPLASLRVRVDQECYSACTTAVDA